MGAIAKAYVANLGAYNEGALIGGWIDLPTTNEEIDRFLKNVVMLDDTYEEYAIHDWESDYISYPGEYANLYALNEQAEQVTELSEYEWEVLAAAQEVFGDIDVSEFDVDEFIWYPGIHTDEELGYAVVDEYGDLSELGDTLYAYIDTTQLGRDLWFDYESSFREDYEYEHGEDYSEEDFEAAFRDYIEMLVDEIVDSPEMLGDNVDNYFDYEAYGRDVRLEANGGFAHDGFIIWAN